MSSEVMILLHCPQSGPEDVDDEKRVTDLSNYENHHCLNKNLWHLQLLSWPQIMQKLLISWISRYITETHWKICLADAIGFMIFPKETSFPSKKIHYIKIFLSFNKNHQICLDVEILKLLNQKIALWNEMVEEVFLNEFLLC